MSQSKIESSPSQKVLLRFSPFGDYSLCARRRSCKRRIRRTRRTNEKNHHRFHSNKQRQLLVSWCADVLLQGSFFEIRRLLAVWAISVLSALNFGPATYADDVQVSTKEMPSGLAVSCCLFVAFKFWRANLVPTTAFVCRRGNHRCHQRLCRQESKHSRKYADCAR
jgi:hypothetical protein